MSDKKCDSETTNLQLLCDLQAPPIFPAWWATSDLTSCDRPRLTAGTSWEGPIQFSCIFVAGGGENFISWDKIKSTTATSLWLKNGISCSVSVTCLDMQGRAKTHPRRACVCVTILTKDIVMHKWNIINYWHTIMWYFAPENKHCCVTVPN